jgi:glycosyltransferase involved in cell wall biosynthesis
VEQVFVIIPTFGEGTVISSTIESLLPFGYSIVVVDDGSCDRTAAAIRGFGVHYLKHSINLGQGAALQTGTEYALAQGAGAIVHFDADGQHPAEQIPAFIAPILEGECDVVLGSRFLEESDRVLVPMKKRALLKGAIIVSGLLTHVWLTDTHNGFRALSREAARKITLSENRFAHATEILDKIRLAGLRYREMPSTIRYTEYSIGKGQSITNSFRIVFDLILRKLIK